MAETSQQSEPTKPLKPAAPVQARDPEAELAAIDVEVRLLCTYCHDALKAETTVYCARCLAPYHDDCVAGHGGCAAPGCGGTRVVRSEAANAAQRTRRPRRGALLLLSGALLVGAAGVSTYLFAPSAIKLDRTALDFAAEARWLAEQGQHAEALAPFTHALELSPKDATLHADRGASLFALGRLPDAVYDYDRALELAPDLAIAWARRGTAKLSQGVLRLALADLARALELAPNLAQAWRNRGYVNLKLERSDAAVADLDRALELEPGVVSAWLHRGQAKAALQQYQAALSDLDRALEIDPGQAGIYLQHARVMNHLGRVEGAIQDYGVALRLGPDDAVVYTERGIAQAKLGHYAAALADLEHALRLAPNEAVTHYQRGVTLQALGAFNLAVEALDRALALGLTPELTAKARELRAAVAASEARSRLPRGRAGVALDLDTLRRRANEAFQQGNTVLAVQRLARALARAQAAELHDLRRELQGRIDFITKVDEAWRAAQQLKRWNDARLPEALEKVVTLLEGEPRNGFLLAARAELERKRTQSKVGSGMELLEEAFGVRPEHAHEALEYFDRLRANGELSSRDRAKVQSAVRRQSRGFLSRVEDDVTEGRLADDRLESLYGQLELIRRWHPVRHTQQQAAELKSTAVNQLSIGRVEAGLSLARHAFGQEGEGRGRNADRAGRLLHQAAKANRLDPETIKLGMAEAEGRTRYLRTLGSRVDWLDADELNDALACLELLLDWLPVGEQRTEAERLQTKCWKLRSQR